MDFIKKHINKITIMGIVIGAAAGLAYWKFVGCQGGQCMITSQWENSTAYGAIMGGLLFSNFTKSK